MKVNVSFVNVKKAVKTENVPVAKKKIKSEVADEKMQIDTIAKVDKEEEKVSTL